MSNVSDGLKIGCGALVGLVVLVALVFGLAVLSGIARLPLANIERVVTTHTNAYVQAHQTAILNYYADYVSGDAAHKSAARLEVCGQAALLDPGEYPAQVAPFISANCR